MGFLINYRSMYFIGIFAKLSTHFFYSENNWYKKETFRTRAFARFLIKKKRAQQRNPSDKLLPSLYRILQSIVDWSACLTNLRLNYYPLYKNDIVHEIKNLY